MNSDRVTLQRKALSGSEDVDALQASVQGADPSSLERARMLVASRFCEDERSRESMDRGTGGAELLGKLGMDAETRAVALLFPFVDEGALDVAAIEKRVGAQVARLTQVLFVSRASKICAKRQPRLCRRIVCGSCF